MSDGFDVVCDQPVSAAGHTEIAVTKTEGYHIPANADYFEFDASVANIFDNMAVRSIPGYRHFWDTVTYILAHREVPHYTTVWDLGVSTGAGLEAARRAIMHPYIDYYGLDISDAMLAKASGRCPFAKMHIHDLLKGLPVAIERQSVSVFILGWTLQFLDGFDLRKKLVADMAEALHPEGVIFVAEKYDLSDCPEINQVMQDVYISWRRQNGYSLEEIRAKNKALAGSMKPWRHSDLVDAAEAAGLKATPIYRQYAFGGYMLHH